MWRQKDQQSNLAFVSITTPGLRSGDSLRSDLLGQPVTFIRVGRSLTAREYVNDILQQVVLPIIPSQPFYIY